ncbi:UDP-N-acetylmuramoyl-tripeptide--D-alanyl-D-alanine ligase [Mucilaginibacter paludis]|uniref:UDP-N-acetylmuramoyl-tripeptide--D-alanyl-D-alanine ligase n=1 Tax=Mucilaginibacter paludis DSM 18603 TaxID=714943 RepID=H1YIT3_9SPHI|nr:UDP-N-acetylmuramoyl-tripeptide--D-alanyl-D-alanine ligase [Mucilaginibacter paludis]EHQ27628.1 UDP-N-acetylmuramoylalanyl-D-glutamyl-2,6-diamin opimelate/D-alanyl-D-alanylligase [Mucilaginibacter paludis DSM 18603]
MNIEQLYQTYLQHPVISTDTRKIIPGSIFFALKGDKFDANTFAQQALDAGAAYAVIDNGDYNVSQKCILVDDVLSCLQNLARYHRKQLNIPFVGLTGSNGKTTTKELIRAVLSQHFNTYATYGNLNNHIGVPLTILAIDQTVEMAVIEMGANHQKEIELLCSIAQPTHGLITNVGKAHLEGFGGAEGVKKGKGELYDYLKTSKGVIFVNQDSKVLTDMVAERALTDVQYYGSDIGNNISGELLENSPYLKLRWKIKNEAYHTVQSQLTGAYNMDNLLAAICIGHYFKLSPDEINTGLSGYQPHNNRSQIVKTASNTLICDYYNANPSSMFVAIENIGKLPAGRKVVILGDMFELGEESAVEHESVIQKAMQTAIDERIFIGAEFYKQSELVNATFYRSVEDAIGAFKSRPVKNATILIKGSRGMALERLVDLF